MTRRLRNGVEWVLTLIALSGCGKVHSDQTLGLRDRKTAVAGRTGSSVSKTDTARYAALDAGSLAAPRDAAAGPLPMDVAAAGGNAAGGARAIGSVAGGAPADAGPPQAAPEVWIGQLHSTEPALCDPVPVPPGTLSVPDPAGYTERVVLVLEREATGVRGRIQFGDSAALKALPAPDGKDQAAVVWKCSISQPTKGAQYTLLEPVLTSERLTFAIAPNEVWDTWCTTQLPPCTEPSCMDTQANYACSCDGTTCRANLNARLAIFLAVTADTIEGELSFGGRGLPADVRLKRVQ